jgi:hypothetical protein
MNLFVGDYIFVGTDVYIQIIFMDLGREPMNIWDSTV